MERGRPVVQPEKSKSIGKEIAIGAAETAGGLLIAWGSYKYATHFREPGVAGLMLMATPSFFINAGRHFKEARKLKPKKPNQSQSQEREHKLASNPFRSRYLRY